MWRWQRSEGCCAMGSDLTDDFYRSLFYYSMDGVLLTAPDGGILAANPAACEMFGRTEEEICKAGRSSVVDVSDPRLVNALAERTRAGNVRAELTYIRADGTRFPAEIASAIFKDCEGNSRTAMIIRDITERKRIEGEREQYFKFFMLSTDAMCIADPYGRFKKVNPAFSHMTGFAEDELASKPFLDFILAEDRQRTEDEMKLQVTARPSMHFENRYVRKDGSVIVLSWTAYFDKNDGVTYATARDITEGKRAQEALRAAEQQFRCLVEQSIAGSYIIQDGTFAYVNQRLAEIFGYGSADEMIGRDPLSLVAEKDRGMAAKQMRQRIESGVANVAYEFHALRKDGSIIDIGVQSSSATYLGRPAIIGLMQDISEKKRAQEEIRRYVEQLKTAFMSTVEVATTLSEMRDPYTAGHERRVAEIAVAIGAELGLDERQQQGLRVAGYLHDVGKIVIPSEILSKPGKLSVIEFQLVQGHAQAGYDVLKAVEFPWPVAQVALQHHERMDGSGYPQGLKGAAILLEARIMAVADVVEAMSSHRPYRPGLGIESTLSEIERGRGSIYDAEVAGACLRLFRENRYQLPA
jgi:PAS domain S-box-containing protein